MERANARARARVRAREREAGVPSSLPSWRARTVAMALSSSLNADPLTCSQKICKRHRQGERQRQKQRQRRRQRQRQEKGPEHARTVAMALSSSLNADPLTCSQRVYQR